MTSFQLPPAIFPENAITRAERAYQQNVSETSTRRRWINRAVKGIVAAYALLQLGILFVASLTLTNPVPIASQLLLVSALLAIIVIYYHFHLMYQAISISTNSIVREKQNRTWETLAQSGANARQIVWGKWWVTVQGLLPRYLLLGVLRAGGTAAVGMAVAVATSIVGSDYNGHIEIPHPITILIASLLAIVLTVANLGFSAACGMMSAAVSKRSNRVIVLSFTIQALMSLVAAIILMFSLNRLLMATKPASGSSYTSIGFSAISLASTSVIDNGFTALSNPLYVSFASRNVSNYSSILPLTFDWIIAALITLVFYAVVIWFALWVAQRSVWRLLVTPSS